MAKNDGLVKVRRAERRRAEDAGLIGHFLDADGAGADANEVLMSRNRSATGKGAADAEEWKRNFEHVRSVQDWLDKEYG